MVYAAVLMAVAYLVARYATIGFTRWRRTPPRRTFVSRSGSRRRNRARITSGLAVLLFGLGGCQASPVPETAPQPSSSPQPTPPLLTPSPSPSPSPSLTLTPSPSPRSGVALRPGSAGAAVLALQQRLVDLGFWLGTPDGAYGALTAHAVTAFQKSAGLGRDGIAGETTLNALDRAARVRPRSVNGNRIEVDLQRQLLLVVADGRTRWVMDTSTGKVSGTTPLGHHAVYRQVDGYHTAPLGVLYRPKYIHEGVAVHGYPSVPPYPASHGCIRVANSAMDWLWSSGTMPIGTDVWVY